VGSGAISKWKNRKKPKRRLSRLSRWLLWIGAILLVVAVAIGATIAYFLHRAEPMLRASIVDTLQKRFHSRVELDNLHVSVTDGFWVEGNGLRIWLPEEVQEQSVGNVSAPDPTGKSDAGREAQVKRHIVPWISVGKLRFHASGRILPGKPIVVSVVYVEGVKVVLPPKEERPHISIPEKKPGESSSSATAASSPSSQSAVQPVQSPNSRFFQIPPIQVRRVECKDATLLIERKQEPGKVKVPLDFEFAHVTLIPDSHGGPTAFDVKMTNAKPVGQIHSTGHFGPWVAGDPHALPLEGDYSFDNADLGTIKGIAGILSSTGHYSGTLSQIVADGTTRTPDFRLERVHKGTGVLLTTKFHAIVDGTNGNTLLEPVDAMLGHTHIVARCKGPSVARLTHAV